MTFAWPDLVIGGLAILFAVKGWGKGFVSELAGTVALFIAVFAALRYAGSLDATVAAFTHLGPGSAHALGLIVEALIVYLAVLAVAWVLGRVAKLPVIGLANSLAGALVGAAKALFGAWVILYIVLFLPLSRDLRGDLHRSTMVAIVTQPNAAVDDVVRGLLPWFVRPFALPLLRNHHA